MRTGMIYLWRGFVSTNTNGFVLWNKLHYVRILKRLELFLKKEDCASPNIEPVGSGSKADSGVYIEL